MQELQSKAAIFPVKPDKGCIAREIKLRVQPQLG
jgi:hypothetical protein